MIITLTTDFGTADPFVGLMKGVILGIAPQVSIVDLSHETPPRDIVAGALLLDSTIGHFPSGTIHVAVIDPGVGDPRTRIAMQTSEEIFVGPNNGLFSAILARRRPRSVVALTNGEYHHRPVSDTFHGRDVFAPVAAHLANGVPLSALGPQVEPATIPLPEPWAVGDALELHVLRVDRFGNLITDLTRQRFEEWLGEAPKGKVALQVGNRWIRGLARTFSDAESGAPLAYFGSTGQLEIAVRDGHAADALEATRETLIQLRREE